MGDILGKTAQPTYTLYCPYIPLEARLGNHESRITNIESPPPMHYDLFHTRRTARVFRLGEPSAQTREVWLVLHGYRQLAQNFLRRFAPIAAPGRLIVAPEGLSRFYVDGVRGKVGASWMTREARELEIADQQIWLDQVLSTLQQQVPPDVRWHLLGFSQGVATAWRWLQQSAFIPEAFTIWAGTIPEEFTPEMEQRMSRMRLTLAYGDRDEFIDPERARAYVALLQGRYPHLELLPFSGRHDIPQEPLLELLQRWEGKA